MYSFQIIEEPAEEPVTVDELGAELGLSDAVITEVTDKLTRDIVSARLLFEAHTGRACISQSIRQWFADWENIMCLVLGPVSTIEDFKYYDEDGAEQTFEDYTADLNGIKAYLIPNSYPNLDPNRVRCIWVEYTVGWEDASAVPADVKQAILNCAALHFRCRESHTDLNLKELPLGWQSVVNKYITGIGVY